ncbi:MAG TPA: lipid II flippase MurJ, partial [Pirellulales bacterium]|nr:lipid II flippase MurJ [Pirellulales bacterium]
MANRDGWQLWGGFWATSLGTLASRVLGLVRDMATASLLGLGEGSVMDALVIAFRTANLPRRIFGEGALAASFLPVFSRLLERDPQAAWQLISVLMSWLTVLLTALVLVGEGICVLVAWAGGHDSATLHLAGLTAVLLPYAIFVCLAAQASAALQALLEFRLPAVVPSLLNVCWLAAAWIFAPCLASEKIGQAYIIAVAVIISGVLQFAVQWPALMRFGF